LIDDDVRGGVVVGGVMVMKVMMVEVGVGGEWCEISQRMKRINLGLCEN
jgi:hypothetical protein